MAGFWVFWQSQLEEEIEKSEPDFSLLCNKFSEVPDEINCEEAIETEVSAPDETELQEVWSVKINLETPIETPANETRNKAEILISKKDGHIVFIRLI